MAGQFPKSKERPILRKFVVWFILFAPALLSAASSDGFYERLYVRGMGDFRAGDYQLAYTELHKAAFGFVEQVEKFETAEIYAAIAANRLGHEADTRDALIRITAAENIQPHFRSIAIPDALRVELYRAAATLLTKKEGAVLGVPEPMLDAAAKEKSRVAVPTPGKRPNVAVTAPREDGDSNNSPETTETQAASPTPAPNETQPAVPAPPSPPQSVDPAPAPSAQHAEPAPDPLPQPVASQSQPVGAQTSADHVSKSDGTTTPENKEVPARVGTLQATVPMMPAAPEPAQKTIEVRLADAQKAIDDGNPDRARSIYGALLRGPRLPHAAALRLAEGLYRVRDFAGAIRAFRRAGLIGAGEERYHYYYAVALFETGNKSDARRELDAALPFIEVTSDVAVYRAKIQQATK